MSFLALAMLQARYDANTAASLLQCVMEVVSPPTIKNHQGIAKGITEWEVRLDGLKMEHDESLSVPIKIVVLVGMLPEDYQDMCSKKQASPGCKKIQKNSIWNCVTKSRT